MAKTSPSRTPAPSRTLVDISQAGALNMRLASATPPRAPPIWATTYRPASRRSRRTAATVTAGLKCAPEIGPRVQIRTPSAATGHRVDQKVRRLIVAEGGGHDPEPTTAATRTPVLIACGHPLQKRRGHACNSASAGTRIPAGSGTRRSMSSRTTGPRSDPCPGIIDRPVLVARTREYRAACRRSPLSRRRQRPARPHRSTVSGTPRRCRCVRPSPDRGGLIVLRVGSA